MKIGLLIAGIVLMMVGVGGFFSMQQSISDCGSFAGQLGRTFVSDVNQRCQVSSGIEIGAAVIFVIGLGLTIGGAVAKGKDSQISRWKNPSKYLHEEFESGYKEVRSKGPLEESTKELGKKDNIRYLGILKERLAKGEISKEEYDELKKEFET